MTNSSDERVNFSQQGGAIDPLLKKLLVSSIIQKFNLFKLFIILTRNGKETTTVIKIINIISSIRSDWYSHIIIINKIRTIDISNMK